MKPQVFLLFLLSAGFGETAALAAPNSNEAFAPNYWNESMPYLESSVRCRIEFKSKSPEKLLEKISVILAKHGANAGQRGSISKKDAILGPISGPMQTFDIAPTGAESLAKSLTTLDTLDGFSCSPGSGVSSKRLPFLDEKIGILEKELNVNSKSLTRMPVTRSLLRMNLDYLRSLRSQIASAWARATIEVTALDVR